MNSSADTFFWITPYSFQFTFSLYPYLSFLIMLNFYIIFSLPSFLFFCWPVYPTPFTPLLFSFFLFFLLFFLSPPLPLLGSLASTIFYFFRFVLRSTSFFSTFLSFSSIISLPFRFSFLHPLFLPPFSPFSSSSGVFFPLPCYGLNVVLNRSQWVWMGLNGAFSFPI